MHETLKSMLAEAKPYSPPTDSTDNTGVASVLSVPDGADWPDPVLLKTQLLPVQPLSMDMMPEPYRARVEDISHRMQCPPDIAAISMIVVTATVIGTGCGIRPKCLDDWLLVPNLYGLAVARPSILLKTPTLTEAIKPILRLEVDAHEAFDTATKYHDAQKEMFKAEKDALKNSMSVVAKKKSPTLNADMLIEQYANMQEPAKPTLKRYRTNDATVEKLSELLNENPRGMLLFRDEFSATLATWEKEGREADRAFFLEAWNGKGSHYSDRIGRGTIFTRHLCVSMLGGIQPDKLLAYLNACRRDNDGIFQRFQMLVYPDEPQHWDLVDERPDREAAERVFTIIKALSEMDFTQHGATCDEHETIPYLRYQDDAQKLFYEWLSRLEKEKLRGGGTTDGMLLEHLSKYRKLMPSLSLIFHAIDMAAGNATGGVTLASTQRAIQWCEYLESHARRVYGMVEALPMKAAQSLLAKIKAGELDERFSLRDIYRHQWAFLTDREIVQVACDTLIAHHWLREVSVTMPVNLRTRIEYMVTPKLKMQTDNTDSMGSGSIVSSQ